MGNVVPLHRGHSVVRNTDYLQVSTIFTSRVPIRKKEFGPRYDEIMMKYYDEMMMKPMMKSMMKLMI